MSLETALIRKNGFTSAGFLLISMLNRGKVIWEREHTNSRTPQRSFGSIQPLLKQISFQYPFSSTNLSPAEYIVLRGQEIQR